MLIYVRGPLCYSLFQLRACQTHAHDSKLFAGAVGLVFLIVGAIVIWYCCQFAFKSEKSIYSEYFPQIRTTPKIRVNT